VTIIGTVSRQRLQKGRPDRFDDVGNEYDRAWKTAHNSYLIVASELGVAGLIFFGTIIFGSLKKLNQIRKLSADNDIFVDVQTYANVTISSILIYVFCAMFLSQAYSALLVVLIACSVFTRNLYYQIKGSNLTSS